MSVETIVITSGMVVILTVLAQIKVKLNRLEKELVNSFHFSGVETLHIETRGGGGGGTGKVERTGEYKVVNFDEHEANCAHCSKGGSTQDKCKVSHEKHKDSKGL